jgi:hypothetical protein
MSSRDKQLLCLSLNSLNLFFTYNLKIRSNTFIKTLTVKSLYKSLKRVKGVVLFMPYSDKIECKVGKSTK